ncbi:type III secretion system export apparatus subunit SctS [Aquabacterium sp. A7-Y]|uniref:type III secretion system export apparatus subunit SctS n=1 Tax=Aquabacterium sp. A7-Y TaxID=1349605 RepID=UPI00223CE801|nr:type III secretion system export apparatus subunit SctS [Aquabacterium sp. A7-Y]MCW7540809.1 type III secretion system export apparatus subunit SctS [Aquabacterium sp. A7-Y]
MSYDTIIQLTSEALMMCVLLSLPAVAISAIVGLLVSFFQAITSLQDSSISQGIKLLAVTVVVFIAAPWAGATLLRFSENILETLFR